MKSFRIFIFYTILSIGIDAAPGGIFSSSLERNSEMIDKFRDCPDGEVSFQLFTIENSVDGEEILINGSYSNLYLTNFNSEWPTKIIVHGFRDHPKKVRLVKLKEEYLKKGPHNIIYVDWGNLAAGFYTSYLSVKENVYPVGLCVARLIQKLRDKKVGNIHAIGYSLGGQVSAAAAYYSRPYIMDRITGLDPAGPGFTSRPDHEKLDKTDAKFVDVYHTNYGIRGYKGTCGHIDFYMNGGFYQPGCWTIGCSHYRSLEYFAESINSEVGFWGWQCKSLSSYEENLCPVPEEFTELAGNQVKKNSTGLFIVKTNSASPFAKGKSLN